MSTTRHIVTLVFFLIIYYLLMINGKKEADPHYAELERVLDSSIRQTSQQTRELIEDTGEQARHPWGAERYLPYLQRMNQVSTITDSGLQYIYELKERTRKILAAKGNKRKETRSVRALLGKYSMPEISARLDAYFDSALDRMVNPVAQATFRRTIPRAWRRMSDLSHVTSARDLLAILKTYEHDIVVTEYCTIYELWKETGCLGCGRMDQINALAIPEKSIAFPGEKQKATISLISYNRMLTPLVECDKGAVVKTENGVCSWERRTSELGIHKVSGTISLFLEDEILKDNWTFQYLVMAKGISMQLDKADVCYVGVENPITISVPGYPDDALKLRVKGAEVRKMTDGHYHLYWDKLPKGKVFAQVDATNEQGRTSTVAGLELKVRMPPLPLPTIAGKNNGYLMFDELEDARGIEAAYERNIDIDLGYEIVSYKVNVIRRRGDDHVVDVPGKGGLFRRSQEIVKVLRSIRPGDRLAVTDIIACDENGRKVALTPILLWVTD